MSCCGKKRALLQQENRPSVQTRPVQNTEALAPFPVSPALAATRDSKWFEYTGPFELSVTGMVSQRLYRFSRPGAQVEVAMEDVPALMSEKDLRLKKR